MNTNSQRKAPLPRLGQINYINSLPIALPIIKGMIAVEAEVYYANPSQLNCRYEAGSLDLGAMSTFFYLQNHHLSLMPDLSISSVGPVGSVLFFCKVELQANNHFKQNLKIAVPTASATSINLLSILLQEQFAIVPTFIQCSVPDLTSLDVDGALVIGDYALAQDAHWQQIAWRYDLGEWWQSRFNLPMVFAVWAARHDWQVDNEDLFNKIGKSLLQSCQLGLTDAFAQVVDEAKSRTGLPTSRIEQYFRRQLDFSLSADHLASINRYKSLCEKYQLLKPRCA